MATTVEDLQAQTLRRIAARDMSALAEFYDQTAGALFSIAFRILGDAPEAEEVIQDVFVQIWEKAGSFDPSLGLPIHWAIGITRNRSIDRLRSRQRRARLMDELQDVQEIDIPTGADSAPDGLGGEELGAIRAAVARLPEDQRQAIEMAFFGGLTHPEIAAALQQPLGTIKARIRRGMMKLKDSLQEYL